MENLIDKSIKLTALLIEYRESVKYEKCKYHFFEDEKSKSQFFLFLIEEKKLLIYGNISRIKSYLRLRNINHADIYTLVPELLQEIN